MKLYGGSAAVDGNNVAWKSPPPHAGDNWIDGDIIDIPIVPRSNLPMIRDLLPSERKGKEIPIAIVLRQSCRRLLHMML